jgi:hypothetical protein
MGSLSKSFALILILIMVIPSLSLLTIKTASAQTIPTPSVPQFTAKFIDASYNKTSIDPYSGQQVTQFILNRTIEIIIQNQPLATYNSSGISFYYNIRMKGHFENTWTNVSTPTEGLLLPSSSKTTVYSYTEGQFSNAPPAYNIGNFFFQPNPNSTAEIDIQVEAMIGSLQIVYPSNPFGFGSYPYSNFVGQESGWTNTQTLTIPAISSSTSPASTTSTQSSTSTPARSASNALLLPTTTIALIVIAFLLAIIIALLLYIRKQNRLPSVVKRDEVNG